MRNIFLSFKISPAYLTEVHTHLRKPLWNTVKLWNKKKLFYSRIFAVFIFRMWRLLGFLHVWFSVEFPIFWPDFEPHFDHKISGKNAQVWKIEILVKNRILDSSTILYILLFWSNIVISDKNLNFGEIS